MKLYMKQKVFSWRDKFTVKDESGIDRYQVEGEFLSLGKRLHVLNESNVEVALIRQKLLAWMPQFFVEIDGREICKIVKRLTLLRPKYELEGLSWHVEGDILSHEYMVYDGSRAVMGLSKHWLTWGDSYELDIADQKDELLCLSIALAIDAVLAAANSAAMSATT